jgi:hypothetical protein
MIVFYSYALLSQSTIVGDNSGATIDGTHVIKSRANVNLGGCMGQNYVIDNVKIDMSNPFNSVLELKLISPYGTSLELSINDGGFSKITTIQLLPIRLMILLMY